MPEHQRPPKTRIANALLFIIASLLSIAAVEAGLRRFTPFPLTTTSNTVRNDELLYVMDPSRPDIDHAGFRNPPDKQATIYAIGDSHTYGYNVAPGQSWPYQLERMLSMPVYNMAVPSYGIYQYFRLFEMASESRPTYIILGFYPANDLLLNSCLILNLQYWINRMNDLGLSKSTCQTSKQTEINMMHGDSDFITHLISAIKGKSAILSAFGHLVWTPFQTQIQKYYSIFTDDLAISAGSYILYIPRSLLSEHEESTDLSTPAVREHFSNSTSLFMKMQRMAKDAGISFGVLIIPSKERVVQAWANQQKIPVPDVLTTAAATENKLVREYMSFFRQNAIAAIDAEGNMVDLLTEAEGKDLVVYPRDDGHPLESGYAAYARAASTLVRLAGRGADPPPGGAGHARLTGSVPGAARP